MAPQGHHRKGEKSAEAGFHEFTPHPYPYPAHRELHARHEALAYRPLWVGS